MNNETIHVLLVDDDDELLETVAVMLRQHDNIIVTAESTVADALDEFDETFIDCIVSDYEMPGMDGLDFLTAIRWHSTEIPFIVTTAHGSERVASEAIRSGATDYVVKKGGWVENLAEHVTSAVTARKQGKLAHANTRFQRVIGAVGQYAIIMLDRHGHVMTWSEGAASLSGYESSDAIGGRIHDLFADETAAEELLERAQLSDEVTVDALLEGPSGTTIPVSGALTYVDGEFAEPTYFALVLHRPAET